MTDFHELVRATQEYGADTDIYICRKCHKTIQKGPNGKVTIMNEGDFFARHKSGPDLGDRYDWIKKDKGKGIGES